MDVEEDFLKTILGQIMKQCKEELIFLEGFTKLPLRERMQAVIDSNIVRIRHEDAIRILKESGESFEFVSVGRFSPFRVGLKTPISVNLKSPMHHVCY